MKINYQNLEKKINVKFKNANLLSQSLTHKSFDSNKNNEKIEFLGDRVLGLVIAKKLLEIYPDEKEGILDKKFASLVNKKTCLEIAQNINLDKFILTFNPNNKKVKIEDKIISDSCEALIGAVYLDKGFNTAEKVILDLWKNHIKKSVITHIDAKTKLQELTLKNFKKLPTYKLISNTGPRHKPLFKVGVKLPNTKYFISTGKSKKDAEQNAALECLKYINWLFMNWIDEGFLISKNRYSENSLIVELYTKDHGKTSGIIFGGTSKKIKNYLQIGNKLHINYNSKNDNRIGYFKIEIISAYSPLYFDHKQKLLCITSATNLIKILTAESQVNIEVYKLIDSIFLILKDKDWLKKYIFWELELLKLLGYDLELKNLVTKDIVNNETVYYANSSNEKKYVPNFLVERDLEVNDDKILLNGLKLVGDYLDKTILKPNNINYPNSRLLFINSFK